MMKMESSPFMNALSPDKRHAGNGIEDREVGEAGLLAEGIRKNLEDFLGADENEDAVVFGGSLIRMIEDYCRKAAEAKGLSGNVEKALAAKSDEHNQMANSYEGYILGEISLNGEKVLEYQVNTDGEGMVINKWNPDALKRACRKFYEKLS